MQVEPTDDELARGSAIRLALRARAALGRRERWLDEAVVAFDAAVPERIRGDERFAQALADAETVDALDHAMASHGTHEREWWATAMALLRAIQVADLAYKRELGEALARYHSMITTGNEEHGDSETWAP